MRTTLLIYFAVLERGKIGYISFNKLSNYPLWNQPEQREHL